jgi:hypothetical protein
MLDYPALRPLSLVVLTLNKVLWWVLPPLTVRRGCWASSSHTVVNLFLFFLFLFLFCLMVARSKHHSRDPILFPLAGSHIPSLVLEPLSVTGKNIEGPPNALPPRTSPSAWMDPPCDSCHSRPSLMPMMHNCSARSILPQPAPTP